MRQFRLNSSLSRVNRVNSVARQHKAKSADCDFNSFCVSDLSIFKSNFHNPPLPMIGDRKNCRSLLGRLERY